MNARALNSQFQTYTSTPVSRDQTLQTYSGLIRMIARRIANGFPANLDLDDLISDGYMGLIDAMEKFDSTRNLEFATYAEFRIRGAILDGIRDQDWVPRSVRNQAKAFSRANSDLEKALGRQANSEELCLALGLDIEDFHRLRSKILGTALVSIIDLEAGGRSMESCMLDPETGDVSPHSEMERKSLRRHLETEISRLPEIQQQVLISHYFDDLPLKDIAQAFAFSESRASQLHREAIAQLRSYLDRRLKRREKKPKS